MLEQVGERAAISADYDGLRIEGPAGAVDVRRKLMTALRLMADRHGRTVTRQDLLDAVWPDRIASDESVTQLVSELRRALREAGFTHAVIETVSGRGYRLSANVDWSPPPSAARPGAAAVRVDPRFWGRRTWMTAALMVAVLTHAIYRHGPW